MFEGYGFIGIAYILFIIFCISIVYFIIVSIKNKNREYAYFLITFFLFSFLFFLSSFFSKVIESKKIPILGILFSLLLTFSNYLLIRKESTLKQVIKKVLNKSLIIIIPLGLIISGIYLS